jgi:hypothetical protein
LGIRRRDRTVPIGESKNKNKKEEQQKEPFESMLSP